MDEPLLLAAVRNNAEWCDAVCRARGIAGRFTEQLWITNQRTPPYYPNIITLRPSSDALVGELADALARLRAVVGDRLSIKDSFADLDLATSGLRVLFPAEWIVRAGSAAPPSGGDIAWSTVRDEAGLAAWKAAWDAEILKADPVFASELLGDEDVAFFAGHRGGELVGGGIANRGAEVVGLSNVFARTADDDAIRAGCVSAATAWAPGLPVVGYESGQDLRRATALGFRTMGPLRVLIAAAR